MMKKILFVLIGIIPSMAMAIWDYKYRGLVRSFPVGVFASAELGKGFKVWDKSEKANFLYGYVRPSIQAQTSAVVNSASARLSFFPISILSLSYEYAYFKRDLDDLSGFDCSLVICRGEFGRSIFGAKLGLAFGDWFGLVESKWQNIRSEKKGKPFAEEQAALIGRPGRDTIHNLAVILGKKLGNGHSLGQLSIFNQMKHRDGDSRAHHLLYQYEKEKWKYIIAPGLFYTRVNGRVGSLIMIVDYIPEKGLNIL